MTVKLRITVAVVVLLQAGPMYAQALQYKFKAGQTLRYDLTVGNKFTGKTGDMEGSHQDKQVYSMTWKVESVDEKGTARIRLTVDRVKLSSESGKDSIEVSSDAAKEPDKEPAKSMYAMAKSLTKFDGSFSMTARGQIEKVTIPPETLKAMRSVPGAEKAPGMTEEELEHTLKANTFVLPPNELKKGENWKEKMEANLQGFGKFAGDLVFTYEGTAAQGGANVAKFVVKPHLKIEPDPKAKIMLKNVDSGATIYFDPAAGQLVEVTSSQVMEFAGEDNGKKVSNRTETTNTLKRAK